MQEAGCAAPVLHSSRGLELIAPGPNLHIASSPPLFMSHAQHHNAISMRTTQMCTTTPRMQVKFQVAAYPLCATQQVALPGPCLGCPHRLPLLQVAGTGPSLAPDLTVYATCCCVVELKLRPAAGRHHDDVLCQPLQRFALYENAARLQVAGYVYRWLLSCRASAG